MHCLYDTILARESSLSNVSPHPTYKYSLEFHSRSCTKMTRLRADLSSQCRKYMQSVLQHQSATISAIIQLTDGTTDRFKEIDHVTLHSKLSHTSYS